MDYNFIEKKIDVVLLLFIVFSVLFLLIGCIFFSRIFYDNFIWRYFWGPVVADSLGGYAVYNGISAEEGYSIVSEVVYGLILISSLYYLYKLLKRLDISIDNRFVLSLFPLIIYGPVTRVLEDSSLYTEPFVYWFISPLIYIQIAFFALILILSAWFFNSRGKIKSKNFSSLFYPFIIFVLVDSVNLAINFFGVEKNLSFFELVIVFTCSLLVFLPVLFVYKKRSFDPDVYVFSGGLLLLIPSLYMIAKWFIGYQWSNSTGLHYDVLILVFSIISMLILMVYLFSKKFQKYDHLIVYSFGLNLSMLAGHLIDGVTSYISIKDPLNMGLFYAEKHHASNLLLNL
ncbi:MAG: DUF63 family protein, partial [Candidatus Thermoplasmatota archaeon]